MSLPKISLARKGEQPRRSGAGAERGDDLVVWEVSRGDRRFGTFLRQRVQQM